LTAIDPGVTILDACRSDLSQLAEPAVVETEPERIRKILRDAFDAALLERDTASEAFDGVLRQIPSGLPKPDGVQQIKNASSALSVAREKMSVAMIRLREFENRGIVPEDLKRKPAQKQGGGRQARSGSG
jgi:hypothetical protein